MSYTEVVQAPASKWQPRSWARPRRPGRDRHPFGRLDARPAASFYRHGSGLGMADRVCLALARSLSSPAYTADRARQAWGTSLDVKVVLIR